MVTHTVWETVHAPDKIVFVDQDGNFISEGFAAAATPPPSVVVDPQVPAPAPAEPQITEGAILDTVLQPEAGSLPVAEEPPIIEQPVPEPEVEQPPAEDPPAPESYAHVAPEPPTTPEPPAPQAPAPPPEEQVAPFMPAPAINHVAPESNYGSQKRSGYGIGWSNYNGDEISSSCKSHEQADQEWAQLTDYDVVRVYGVDCGQPGISFELAKKYNKKVFVGIYWLDHRLDQQIADIVSGIEAAGAGWDPVDTISVGNEDVHRGEKTPGEVIAMVSDARMKLRKAGYQGPVVHVDSQDQFLANPELCSEAAGDYIAANIHPFFNAHNSAENAGEFVADQIELLRQCGASTRRRREDVRVRATEVGWPKAGSPNGIAVPSKDNQITAIESIKSQNFDQLILFSAFDNKWMKDGPNTFNTEKFWGILDP